jgi:hypothetical protein
MGALSIPVGAVRSLSPVPELVDRVITVVAGTVLVGPGALEMGLDNTRLLTTSDTIQQLDGALGVKNIGGDTAVLTWVDSWEETGILGGGGGVDGITQVDLDNALADYVDTATLESALNAALVEFSTTVASIQMLEQHNEQHQLVHGIPSVEVGMAIKKTADGWEPFDPDTGVVDPPPPGGSIPDFGRATFFGHSYVAGTSLAAADRFANKIAASLECELVNYGANSGVITQTNSNPTGLGVNYGTWYWMLRTLRATVAGPATGIGFLLTGINDFTVYGAPQTATKINSVLKAVEVFASRWCAVQLWEAEAGLPIAKGANWTTPSFTTINSGSGAIGASGSPAPGPCFFTPTGQPADCDYAFGFISSGQLSGVSKGGAHTMFSEGVPVGSHNSQGNATGQAVGNVYRFQNIDLAAPTLGFTTETVYGQATYLDYVSQETADSAPLGIFHQPRLTAAGLAAHSNLYTNADIDTYNAGLDAIAARFSNDRVFTIPVPDMNANAAMFRTAEGDPLHPNVAGAEYLHSQAIARLEEIYA